MRQIDMSRDSAECIVDLIDGYLKEEEELFRSRIYFLQEGRDAIATAFGMILKYNKDG